MTDERNGKPSASGMSRLALCPGSWNLESDLPPQEPNQYMTLGTDIHAVLADQKPFEELSEEGQDVATKCLSEYSDMIGSLNLGPITSSVIEERFWYDELFSGAIDRIDFFGEETAVVTDYKTGRTAQSGAAENIQLRAYAVLVKKAYPNLKSIYVSIIQPLAAGKTIAMYGEADLDQADEQIVNAVIASINPDAPRTPSPDACKWCRAKNVCPEAYGNAQSAQTELQILSGTAIATLSNEELASLDSKAQIVENFIDDIRKELKSRLIGGAQITGLSLTKGRTIRNVTDPTAASSALSDILKPDEFLACTKVSITALEKAVGKARGLKGKDAKSALEEALGWIIESKEGEPSISRDK